MLASLKITGVGYLALALLVLSWFLTYKISIRAKDTGLLSKFFTWIVCLCIIGIFVSTLYMSCQTIYRYFVGTPYQGKISTYTSYQEDYKNSGENRTRTRTMYVSVIQFVDKKGQQHALASSTHSGAIPVVGEEVNILYIEGQNTLLEVNFMSYFLLWVALMFACLFGFLSKGIIEYAWGKVVQYDLRLFKHIAIRSLCVSLVVLGMVCIWSFVKFQTYIQTG